MTRQADSDAPPPEGSLAHERFERDQRIEDLVGPKDVAPGLDQALRELVDEYGAMGVALTAATFADLNALQRGIDAMRPPTPTGNSNPALADLEAHRARDVETHTRRLVIHVDDWVRSLELGPWPGPTSTLRRVAEQFCELDEARCALRAVHLQMALPADDDEAPF